MPNARTVARRVAAATGVAALLYLGFAPVPIAPVRWEAPDSPGFVGVFAANRALTAMEPVPTADEPAPEAMAVGPDGAIYAATEHGWIVRLDSAGRGATRWVQTGGRPLGMAFDAAGTLWVADATRGLLAIASDRSLRVMATESSDARRIGFADDVDVARDGRVYVSDASTKFGPPRFDGLQASLLEIFEHRGHGRLLEYDPATGRTDELLGGLVFANGVALTHDETAVLVAETGSYRILRVEREGPGRGAVTVLIDALPGFPDNITRGRDGRYWVALAAPRNAIVDRLAPYPGLRKVIQRLPQALRPRPAHYGHVIAVDDSGRVTHSLQDPTGRLPILTSALEVGEWLYLGSLAAPSAARVRWAANDRRVGTATQ